MLYGSDGDSPRAGGSVKYAGLDSGWSSTDVGPAVRIGVEGVEEAGATSGSSGIGGGDGTWLAKSKAANSASKGSETSAEAMSST